VWVPRRIIIAQALYGQVPVSPNTQSAPFSRGDDMKRTMRRWLPITVALAVLVSPLTRNLGDRFSFGSRRDLAKAVLVVAFIGTMIEHVTGGLLFASLFGSVALRSWPFIFLVYPFERAVLVLGAVVVCTPLLLASRDLIARFHLRERHVAPP